MGNTEETIKAVNELFKILDKLESEGINSSGPITLEKKGILYDPWYSYKNRTLIPLKFDERSIKEILITIDKMALKRGNARLVISSGNIVKWGITTYNNFDYMISLESNVNEEREWLWRLCTMELYNQKPEPASDKDEEVKEFIAYMKNRSKMIEQQENEQSRNR